MKRKIILPIISAAALCTAIAGCSSAATNTVQEATTLETQTVQTTEVSSGAETAVNSTIELNGASVTAGEGATVEGSDVTISSPGTYEISGKLDDGQIIVETSGEVELLLNGADIYCSDSSPIYVKDCENVTINLAADTVNKLEDGSAYTGTTAGGEPDAVIYSKADMVFTGTGSLEVKGNYNDGITSKDTLLIESGDITVTTGAKAISGKDYLMISSGNITVNAGSDGLKSTNDTETGFGYVEINGGTINVTAVDEGIAAISDVKIAGGTVNIKSENNGIKSDNAVTLTGGKIAIETSDDGIISQTRTITDATVTVNGEAVTE